MFACVCAQCQLVNGESFVYSSLTRDYSPKFNTFSNPTWMKTKTGISVNFFLSSHFVYRVVIRYLMHARALRTNKRSHTIHINFEIATTNKRFIFPSLCAYCNSLFRNRHARVRANEWWWLDNGNYCYLFAWNKKRQRKKMPVKFGFGRKSWKWCASENSEMECLWAHMRS